MEEWPWGDNEHVQYSTSSSLVVSREMQIETKRHNCTISNFGVNVVKWEVETHNLTGGTDDNAGP